MSAVQNCQSAMPDSATIAQQPRRMSPAAMIRYRTEPMDQTAREEAGREHCHDVPGNAERCDIGRKAAANHRERRAGHDEAHQRVRSNGTGQPGGKTRRCDDFAERSRRLRADFPGSGVMGGSRQERQNHHAGHRQADDRRKGAGKHHGSQQFACEDHDLRAEDRRHDATGQHEGNGACLEFGRCIVCGGKTELLNECAADADDEKGEREQPEATPQHRCRGEGTPRAGHDCSCHEADAVAEDSYQRGSRKGAKRHAERKACDGRRRQRLVRPEKIVAGQRADGKGDRRRRPYDRLRDGKDHSRAASLALVGSGRHVASLPRPSPRTRRETRSSTALTSFGSSSS